ncbi:MAG: aldose 1-epimerase [Chitinophagales bacterium]
MFLHTISPFGPHQKHTIHHSELKTSFSIVPGFGGFLSDLFLPHQNGLVNIVEAPRTYEEWQADNYFQSKWLLPFPNRLKGGKYQFEGKEYAFPINDHNGQNALHGFIADHKMQLQKITLTPSYAQITLEYLYDGNLAYYPFPFHLQIDYILMENQLVIEVELRNSGTQKIPIGLGFHPYFQLTLNADELELQLPQCELIEVDNRMIPTGKKTLYTDFEKSTKIGDTFFNTAFKATSTTDYTHKIHLTNPKKEIQLTYFQDPIFPYFQIFIPPHRKSVAIEPMSCNVDAFNNGESLTVLEKGEVWKGSFGVTLS